jgi:hypothetical protein
VVLAEERVVEAEAVGEPNLLEHLGEDLALLTRFPVGLPRRLGHHRVVEDAELHRDLLVRGVAAHSGVVGGG